VRNFAKMYNSERYGQLLIIKDTNENGDLKINVLCHPPGMGVCTIGLGYENEEDWEAAFEAADADMAEKIAAEVFKLVS